MSANGSDETVEGKLDYIIEMLEGVIVWQEEFQEEVVEKLNNLSLDDVVPIDGNYES